MITLSASMGIAQSKGRSPLVVLRELERALRDAQASGRNAIREYSVVSPVQPLRCAEVARPVERGRMPFPTDRR